MSDALEHAYFAGPYRSRRDGSLHGTRRCACVYGAVLHVWRLRREELELFALVVVLFGKSAL